MLDRGAVEEHDHNVAHDAPDRTIHYVSALRLLTSASEATRELMFVACSYMKGLKDLGSSQHGKMKGGHIALT